MKVTINKELRNIVRAGVLTISEMTLTDEVWKNLWHKIDVECDRVAEQFGEMTVGQVPGVSDTRKLYRAVGIDPTKIRPSSEALLRRVIKKRGLYRIHPLVDLFNLASLTTLMPLGLYDESKIIGDTVTIRLGKEGWSFPGIRKGRINVENRLCVTDDEGPFGSPTADSLRTSIEGHVDHALVILFQHIHNDATILDQALDTVVDLAKKHLQTKIDTRAIVYLED